MNKAFSVIFLTVANLLADIACVSFVSMLLNNFKGGSYMIRSKATVAKKILPIIDKLIIARAAKLLVRSELHDEYFLSLIGEDSPSYDCGAFIVVPKFVPAEDRNEVTIKTHRKEASII